MEDGNDKLVNELYVLIVPLWNWNLLQEYTTLVNVCFNRTFMELKSPHKIAIVMKKEKF